ncbi:MAG: ABC transporter permease subunit [Phycisphaerales bacterium]|nr:ABC transporter permease subunit [Phycisphaerales bacterium]MCB9856311.1 ABC transporter permease subunit [Phycisphaerales bacterium]MCB9863250.1 ABC transporter permease subunit [Phycisphaerales bacterium]
MGFTANDWFAVGLSFRVALVATIVFLPACVLMGVWLGRSRHAARGVVQALVMMPLVLPPVVSGLLLLQFFQAAGLRIAFTWIGAVFAAGIVAAPLWIRTVRAAVETIDPRLSIAAESLGASRWRRFRTITLPLCWKGVVGGGVLFAARALGEFGAVMVVAGNTPGRTQTIPMAIYSKLQSPNPGAIWPLTTAAVVIALAAILTGEWLARDGSPGRRAIKGESPIANTAAMPSQ